MSQQAIGKILLMPKGDYSGSATYNSLDWVRYDGRAWVCKLNGTTGVVPAEGDYWTLLAQDGNVSGSVAWVGVTGKPFESIETTNDFTVDGNDKLNIKRGTYGKVRVVNGGTTTDLTASGDSVFEIDAGTNVTITADDSSNPKKITIASTGGGGGGSYTASKGVKLVSDDIQADLKNNASGSLSAASKGSTADREYAVGLDSNNNLSVNIPWTDTTYSNESAAQGGTAVSLVTTGDKYDWNNKSTVSVAGNGTASQTTIHNQRITVDGIVHDIDGTKYMEYTANSASFSFTNSAAISGSSVIDVYTDTWGDNPTNVSISSNTCTVTFASAQSRTVRIYIK